MPSSKKTKSTTATPKNGNLPSARHALSTSNANAHINLGNVLIAQKRYADALASFDAALKLRPDHAPTHVSRGAMLGLLGRQEEALQSYQAALKYDTTNTDALNNAGTILGNMKRHQEAIAHYEQALAAKPNYPEALNNLAVSLAAEKRNAEALEKYTAASALKPDYADAIKNRAELLAQLGRNEEALVAYDQITALLPRVAELHNNRGTVLNALNRHQEALAVYDTALALKPDYSDALNNRGITLAALNRFEEALQCFRNASALKPDYVNAHWNESLSLLRLGRFKEGWEKHEWRWQKPEFEQHKHPFTQPKWLGKEDIADKTILLVSEQGFGDTIHFCRYIPLLEARGASVLLFVPEALVDLLQTSFPRAQVFSKTHAFPAFDYYCPILSLPLAFNTTLDSIPATTPYLHAPGERVLKWRNRIGNSFNDKTNDKKLRVGIVWAGSASHKNDINRSIALDAFSTILQTPNAGFNIVFYSLQTEISAADRTTLQTLKNVTLLGDELNSFADTAAVIDALDLVISVDTSVAHLAAALGKPTWILLPYVSDWRWLPGRADSPWYPTARLYWQPEIGQWAPALQRVADELKRQQPSKTAPQSVTLGLDEAMRTAYEFHRSNKFTDAEAVCKGILQLQSQHYDALQLMGTLHLQHGRYDQAITYFQQALDVNPNHVAALSNLTGALRFANRHDDAYPLYDRAAALAPNNPAIPTNRAVSLIAQKRLDEARESLNQALAIDPRYIAALNNLGVVFNEQRRYSEALQSFDAALVEKPGYQDALNNRGLSLVGLNRLDEADQNYQLAISLNPDNADAYNNRGLALAGMNRIDEALACFRKAQTLKVEYVDAFWNESLMNLVLGNYQDGWQQYEWRWKKPEFAPHKREFHLPQWTGSEDIKGRTIFLHFEQGFGDVIQFVRYIDKFDELGAKVILSAPPPLRKLLEASFPHVGVYCGGETLPPFDFHSSLMSLPLAFGTTLDTIPNRSPYLQVPENSQNDYQTKWRARLPASHDLKIGIVWSGNPKHQNDRNRSIPLASLAALFDTAGCHFYALQKEVDDADQTLLDKYGVTQLGESFDDFTDTAAAIMQLDLVISVDTSVAHLAGALGKPVWLMLAFAPDWRWLLLREDSPWYPTARLFRQTKLCEWDQVLQQVRQKLTSTFRQDYASSVRKLFHAAED